MTPAWCEHPKSGPCFELDITSSIEAQIEWLLRIQPNYLTTYASNAAELIRFCLEHRVKLPFLEQIQTFAEVLPPGTREAAQRVLGVPLYDVYSASEFGYLAIECLEGGSLHVQSEQVLIEILRDDGSPCEAGEMGRIVVTALHSFAMPLIRYELGDYGAWGAPCACGRTLPVLKEVAGRARNLLLLEGGQRYWPRYGSITLGDIAPFEQFRLIQKTFTNLVFEFVMRRELTQDEAEAARGHILAALGRPFELSLKRVETIPRSAGGKFEDFVSEVSGATTQAD